MSALALFPQGFTYDETAGDIVVDHVFPLMRGTDALTLVAVGLNDLIFIEGWATTTGANRRASDAIYFNLDGVPTIAAALGEERTDVAGVHGPQTLLSGFRGAVPLRRVTPGFHTLSASVIDFEKGTYRTTAETRIFVVDPGVRPTRSDAVRLESIADADSDVVSSGVAEILYGARVRVRGSVRKQPHLPPPVTVLAAVEGGSVFECLYGRARSDMDTMSIGFEGIIGSELLGSGRHTIRAIAVGADGMTLGESVDGMEVAVLETVS
jgi:hypothetical protein